MPLSQLGSGWAPRLEALAKSALVANGSGVGQSLQHGLPDLCNYLDLLVAWNQRLDLTAARTPDELVDLTLGDALVMASELGARPMRAVDVGSGAGAPALPLAILCPSLAITLVEPKQKRVAFLRTAQATLHLTNASVVRCRSEAMAPAGFEVAMSRATLAPDVWLPEGARLATSAVWVLLARGAAPSHGGWRQVWEREYRLPLTGVPRKMLRYERAS